MRQHRFVRTLALLIPLLLPASLGAQSANGDGAPEGLFWGVLDGIAMGAPDCATATSRLQRSLAALPDSSLEQFAQGWAAWWRTSYNWDLWGAAYLINGGASDDGFDYFRGWLLTRGLARWRLAATNPDTAFDDVTPGTDAECEDILAPLPDAYLARFHRSPPRLQGEEPDGARWEEADLARRLPHLAKRFGGG